MTEVIEAAWAETGPDADGECHFWRVGKPFYNLASASKPIITRITVQHDLPGMHCNMRRVCVWIGDVMVAEAPVATITAIGYPIPEDGAA